MASRPGLLDLVKLLPAAGELGKLVPGADLGKIARGLGLTPAGVLQRVADMESALGISLLGTATKALRPADAGRIVLDHASRILSQARDLTRDLEELAGLQSPTLNFGTDMYAADLPLGIALGRMASANPRLRVRAALGDFDALAKQVLGGEIEFAIAETAAAERHPKQLRIEPLAEHRMFFFARAGHPLAVDRQPTLEAILEFPLVGTRMPPRVTVHIARLRPRANVERETGDGLPNLAVGSLSVAKSVVMSGDTVGYGPLGAMAAELRAGKLALLRFDAPWMRLSYGLFHSRKRPLSRVAQLLLIQLRQVEDDIEARGRRALARLEKPRPGRAAKKPAQRKPARRTGAKRSPRAKSR